GSYTYTGCGPVGASPATVIRNTTCSALTRFVELTVTPFGNTPTTPGRKSVPFTVTSNVCPRATDAIDVEPTVGTGIERMNKSGVPTVSPGTRSCAPDENTTYRPSRATTRSGSRPLSTCGFRPWSVATHVVVLRTRSRSVSSHPGAGSRSVLIDWNATKRPS